MAAINTNQRFARRAKCAHIWRDSLRGRNETTQRRITRAEVTVGTHWHYIPANGTHTGLWEASVRSLKYHLNGAVTHTKEVNIYQSYIKPYDDVEPDEDSLTPGYFFNGKVMTEALSCGKETECNMTRWQHTQRIVSGLWRRWKCELSKISTKPKCLKREKDGDYVFVNTAKVQPGKWYFGTLDKTDTKVFDKKGID